ncbi:MAG: hypothetical protein PHF56_06090 [Desulfuromonadaceae bacterium]|nr:hypothetical protein [Desulfuromonadaceae bacterium]
MRVLHNENGIALITALMFTALSLVITMSLLYMVTAGIRSSGAMKRYRTTTEAAYGGTDIVVKDLIAASFAFHDYSVANPGTSFSSYMTGNANGYMKNLNAPNISACLRAKLTSPKSKWSVACSNASLNAKEASDITFNLNAASGTPFAVYSKIVDTMERKFIVMESYSAASGGLGKRSKTITVAGNSDTSSMALESGSTTDGSGVTVPHYPYMYRIEVQAERQQNATEKAKMSVQYAY